MYIFARNLLKRENILDACNIVVAFSQALHHTYWQFSRQFKFSITNEGVTIWCIFVSFHSFLFQNTPRRFYEIGIFFPKPESLGFHTKDYLIKDEYDIRYSENIVLINKIIQLLNKINGPFSQVEFLNYQLALIEAQILKLSTMLRAWEDGEKKYYPKTDFSAET